MLISRLAQHFLSNGDPIIDTALNGERAFVVRTVDPDAPWTWLAAGWRDLLAYPLLSLSYGAIFTLISIALAYGLTRFEWQSAVIALSGGFIILGPMVAVGLYEISRRRQEREPVIFADALFVGVKSPTQLAFMGFILLFLFSAWLRLAFLLFAVFYGSEPLPPLADFVPNLLFTPHGLGLLIVGTATGGILALIAFGLSVVSVPLMMEHRIDVITAIHTSFLAVQKNPVPMLLWAALIVAIMACGIAAAFLGLVVAFPLIGHATWHAYRDIVQELE